MLNIIAQYYNDSNPERQAEIDDAFRRNLDCPWVTQLHNLVEPETDVPDWLQRTRNMWNAVFRDA